MKLAYGSKFLWYADRLHPAFLTLLCQPSAHRPEGDKQKEAWVSGLYRLAAFGERNQPSAKGPSLKKAPKVRHRFSASLAKNLSASASMDIWQTWCMRRPESSL